MLTLYELKGDFQKAAECGYKALQNTKLSFGEDHFHVSSIYLRLGILETSLKQFETAEKSFEIAKQIRITKFGSSHDYVADVLHDQGLLHIKWGQREQAKNFLNEAYNIRFKVKGPNHQQTLDSFEKLNSISND